MARKKKKEENVEKDVVTKIQNTARSSGNVKITLIRDGKQIGKVVTHNTGTIDLCDYLVNALVGSYVIAKRPGVIIPYTASHENPVLIGNGSPYINSKVGLSASSFEGWTDDNNNSDPGFCTAVITFLIPSSIISGSQIWGFQLLSKDESKKLYASVALDEPLTVQGDTNIKVEWTLYVSYKWDIDRTAKRSTRSTD